jgi:hypothetical protein
MNLLMIFIWSVQIWVDAIDRLDGVNAGQDLR